MSARVSVIRGGVVESVHRVSVAVADAEGRLVARAGDPTLVTFYRSAAKPIQALPLVEDSVVERFGITAEELAVCCASHSGERAHVEVVVSLLRKVGMPEDALECGPHAPFHEESAAALVRSGGEPRAIHNNCSGKHAGMLALAAAHGWPAAGYHRAEHPVQRRMRAEISRWSGVPESELGNAVDGCGVPTFAVPLHRMATSFARFAAAAARGEPAARVVAAMTGYPYFVAGTGRLCTALMECAGDRLFVKLGAEGVYCAGVPGRGLGVALKVEDGANRANEPALVRVLARLGLLDGGDLERLAKFAEPELGNTRGEVVGEVRAEFELEYLDRRP